MKLNAAFFFLIAIVSVASAPQVSALVGDVNNDNTVNSLDLLAVQANLNKLIGFNPLADINTDSIVNLYDLVLVAQHWGDTYIVTPPSILSSAPTGILPAGTTNTTINVTTNINAVCHYSNVSGTAYVNGTTFNTTGTTTHSTIITGLQNNTVCNYYIRCANATNTSIVDTTDYTINFSISAPSTNGSICEANIGSHCYYVAPNGNDANPGTYALPFKTFKPALMAVAAGDYIYARGGNYTSANNMPWSYCWMCADYHVMIAIDDYWGPNFPQWSPASGTPGHPITLKAYPGEHPIFSAQTVNQTDGTTDIRVSAGLHPRSYWVIDGFEIVNGEIDVTGGQPGATPGRNNHDITIQNNYVHDFLIDTAGNNPGLIRIGRGDVGGPYNIFIRNNHVKMASLTAHPGQWQGVGHMLGGITVLSILGYCGDCGSTGYMEISGNEFEQLPDVFFFKNPMIGPVDIHDNIMHDSGMLAHLAASNMNFTHNLVYNMQGTGFFNVGPSEFPDPRSDAGSGQNATVQYNTFVNITSLMGIAQGIRHNISNNIIFGLNSRMSTAGWDTGGGYITKISSSPDPSTPENPATSILQNISTDNNCFITPYTDFIFVSRYWNTGPPLEFNNFTNGKALYHYDANSKLIIEANLNNVFVNPAANDYHLKPGSTAATQCGAMGYYAGASSDTTPPVRSLGLPSGNLSIGTTQATLNVTTDENATCRYSNTSNTAYASMTNTFTKTGGTNHLVNITGLVDGRNYSYYIRCIDVAGNANTNDYTMSFNVLADVTPPVMYAGYPNGSLSSTITATEIGVKTDEAAYCRYSNTSNTPYASMIPIWNSGLWTTGVTVTGLSADNTYTYYFRCQDRTHNLNTDTTDYAVTFSLTNNSPLVSAEPVFSSLNETMVYQDNMDNYTNATDMGAVNLSPGARIIPQPSPMSTSQPVNTAVNQVIVGRNGTGKALRMSFSGLDQSSADYYIIHTPVSPNNQIHYFQYYARINFTTPLPPGTGFGLKWFLVWHRSGRARTQWALHDSAPWPGPSNHSEFWQVDDQALTASQGVQPVGPYLTDVNDGLWHRFTYEYKPNSALGARDGIQRMWIDGTKIIDVSASAIGVIPLLGEKTWCNADDVDGLVTNDDVGQVAWGATQTGATPPWTVDIDDFTWWTE